MTGLEVEINPTGIEDVYLAGLNRGFGHWGDRDLYRWAFEREVGARAADLMVLRDRSAIVAGSAVSYRTVRNGNDQSLVGVMTGSWTLPEARGHGAFSQVIVESQKLLAARRGTALIAFVTHENASRRRLTASGCIEVPTWYVASNADTPRPDGAPSVEADVATAEELFRAHRHWQADGTGASVVYPSVDIWASQYLDRPLPVEILTVAGGRCLVERAAGSDRVQWFDVADRSAALAGLLKRSVDAGRQLFIFTAEAGLAQAGTELGMVAKPGSITVLDPHDGSNGGPGTAASFTTWRLQAGDRA